MTEKEIKERVRKTIGLFATTTAFSDDDDIFVKVFVNSLQAVELTRQLELGLRIKISQTEQAKTGNLPPLH